MLLLEHGVAYARHAVLQHAVVAHAHLDHVDAVLYGGVGAVAKVLAYVGQRVVGELAREPDRDVSLLVTLYTLSTMLVSSELESSTCWLSS